MLDCSQFLESYSEFRDGLLEEERWEAFRDHVACCDSCARYDRVVGGGVEVFRTLPELSPSADFSQRLEWRLEQLDHDTADRSYASGASLAVTFSLALAFGLTAWLPALRRESVPIQLPPVLAHAPEHPELVPPIFHDDPVTILPMPVPVPVRTGSSYGRVVTPHAHLGSLASYVAPAYGSVRH